MKYKHINRMKSATILYDSKGKGHELLSGESVILDVNREWPGQIEVEEIEEKPKKKYKLEDDD